MSDNSPLLVPIEVKALLVNNYVRKQPFQRWQLNYHNLLSYTSPEPPAFSGNDPDWSTNPKNNGVYLHWTLPAALRRGKHHTTQAATDFPLVPNRWLIVRYSGAQLAERSATAWVVESDYLDPNTGSSRYVDPFSRTLKTTLIGRKLPLDGWQDNDDNPLFLTAVSPGNLTFAAYQPYVENVFSMHDPVTDIADGEILSYMVAGWYSDPDSDILADWGDAPNFQSYLASLGWSRSGEDSARRSVYQGIVYGLTWSANQPQNSNEPQPGETRLAVGSTSIDALTALVQQQVKESGQGNLDPELLQAFQYNLLRTYDQPDGELALKAQIHQAWFGNQPGGYTWEIVAKPPDEAGGDLARQAAYLAEPDWLFELNQAQSAYDHAARELAALQEQLYAVWWKQGNAATLPKYPEGITKEEFADALNPQNPNSLLNKVWNKMQEVAALQQTIPWGNTPEQLASAIASYATKHGLENDRELKRSELGEMWTANDPVVLLYGTGADTIINDIDPLPCRFPNQTVTGFNYNNESITTAVMGSAIPTVPLTHLPQVMGALINEFFFLDPNDATIVAQVALGTNDPEIIAQVAAAMGSYSADIGTVPALVPPPWVQPWSPLFLMWLVTFYPIGFGTNESPNWSFDGTNYHWNGEGADTEHLRQLSGRIFLTPQCSFNFKARLDQFLENNPDVDLKALEDFITSVDNWDFLSQTLAGFDDQLQLANSTALLAPDNRTVLIDPNITLAKLVGGGATAMPIPGPAQKPPFVPWPPSGFQQVRSGQFLFERLMVVDRFGQAVEIVNSQSSSSFKPIIGDGLVPEKFVEPNETYRFVQVTPRLLQPSRLNFEFVSSTADDKVLGLAPGVNPICAWLLPNHLDKAIACYSPAGSALGEAYVVVNTQQQREVIWQPAPNSPYPTFESLQTDFPHLAEFLLGVAAAGPDAFSQLLRVIDETLWTIDPLGARDDQYLSVLIGRPLALVRTRLEYQLSGAPASDPSWRFTFDPLPPDFPGYNFPIRFGDLRLHDDGLIGYFAGSNYQQFNSVYYPTGTNAPYIVQIGPTNYPRLQFNNTSHEYLTMLVDPRAAVNAVTDILPTMPLAIPQQFVAPALSSLAVTFRVGPLLSAIRVPEGGGVPQVIMPQPAEKNGTWSWVQIDGTAPVSYDITPADQTARFEGGPPVLRSGWLQLASALSAAQKKGGK